MATTMKMLFPTHPPVTEKTLPSQKGKVFIVTGASSGIGKQLATILYSKDAKVYIAARSEAKAQEAISDIRARVPNSTGEMQPLCLELSDLSAIKASAESFLSREKELDVLFNNAGVMQPPIGSKSAQGHELQLGVNALGTWLFTHLVHPALAARARTAPPNSVRVVWVSSSAGVMAPKPAVDYDNMDFSDPRKKDSEFTKYARSKAGNIMLACEYARRSSKGNDGVAHVSLDPGLFPTNLQRDFPPMQARIVKMTGKDPIFGAYTELFAGFHESIKCGEHGTFVFPYGRKDTVRKDLQDEAACGKYWDYVYEQCKPYM